MLINFLLSVTPHEKCKLYCKVEGSASYYILKEKVIDGTPCELGGFDICVNGNCEVNKKNLHVHCNNISLKVLYLNNHLNMSTLYLKF